MIEVARTVSLIVLPEHLPFNFAKLQMDVDLSTNLRALPPLLAALIHSDYDLATGSRLMHGAIVTRQWRREIISRSYNLLI